MRWLSYHENTHNVATLVVVEVLKSFYRDIYAKKEKERHQKSPILCRMAPLTVNILIYNS